LSRLAAFEFTDHASGKLDSRPQLDQLLQTLLLGDTLVVWRLDRLGRSLKHLIEVVAELGERGVAFRSITEAIDTSTAGGRLLFHIMGALVEFERQLISERTRAGLQAAKSPRLCRRPQVLCRLPRGRHSVPTSRLSCVSSMTSVSTPSRRSPACSASVGRPSTGISAENHHDNTATWRNPGVVASRTSWSGDARPRRGRGRCTGEVRLSSPLDRCLLGSG